MKKVGVKKAEKLGDMYVNARPRGHRESVAREERRKKLLLQPEKKRSFTPGEPAQTMSNWGFKRIRQSGWVNAARLGVLRVIRKGMLWLRKTENTFAEKRNDSGKRPV